jgi:hypothetical protein
MKAQKLFKILVVFMIQFSFSQDVEKISLKKEISESDYYPNIENYFQGKIPFSKLASVNGIQTRVGWEIKSFDINFITGRDYELFSINSNRIPDTLLVKIHQYSLDQFIFFTNIEARDTSNTRNILSNMSLMPFKDED